MIRTQVSLTEKEANALRQLSAERSVSMAELVREGVEMLLSGRSIITPDERHQRAISAIGRLHSGERNFSEEHDRHLAEAYRR